MTEASNVSAVELGHDSPTTITQYDVASRIKRTIKPSIDSSQASLAMEYTYDGLDRISKTQEGLWDQATKTFSAIRAVSMAYDGLDNQTQQTIGIDVGGNYPEHKSTTASHHDSLGRLVSITKGADTAKELTTHWEYDGVGNVTLEHLTSKSYWVTKDGAPDVKEHERFLQRTATKYVYDELN